MSIESRKACYLKIEQLRGKPLIAYVTSPRPNAGGKMSVDMIPELGDQINALPRFCFCKDGGIV